MFNYFSFVALSVLGCKPRRTDAPWRALYSPVRLIKNLDDVARFSTSCFVESAMDYYYENRISIKGYTYQRYALHGKNAVRVFRPANEL